MRRRLFAFLLPFIALTAIKAQTFEGVIMNAKQRPLKGMKVWRKNTMESVKTDNLGKFVFPELSASDTLVIGVSKKEEAVIPVKGLTRVDIKIEKQFYWLHDGEKEQKREYRRVLRAEMNSNILTREQIQRLSCNSIYDLLKGSISGVTVTYGPNGQQITIRGGNSLEQDTEPLFVVDGSQYESSSEVDSSVAIEDIDRVEVLKDGAAYGLRGANGVIVITTIKK